MGPIAVVGMDCRFPGAADAPSFWDLLVRGGDAIDEVPEYRWNARDFYRADGERGFSNTTRGGFIADADAFDNEFFTISPREAAAMDPQQRLLLQTAWRAVEDAGIAPQRLAGTGAGVFIGIMGNEWAQLSTFDYARMTTQAVSGNGYCMTANRISYHLDLKGPSMAVDTACSSSLVAVHLACNALLAEECDYALAAGVNIAATPALSIFYTQAGLSAPDGRCKPFSADADGIGRAEGVGVLVLRRLENALADGQRVYAVIRGTAVNQDGRSNGITAPNRWSQRDVIAAACRRAGVHPYDVDFLEAHGTGTRLGDRIEANALGDLHGGRTGKPLPIGSVKGNIGHAEGASGIAALIKVALALHHRFVPTSRFAVREDPQLRLPERGLRLIKAPLRLPAGGSVAGVSSFGLGGTNAHAILASAPVATRSAAAAPANPAETEEGVGTGVFTLTAPSPTGLRTNLLAQAEAADRHRGPIGGLCYASNEVKTGHRYRYAVPARDAQELAAALRAAAQDASLLSSGASRPKNRPTVGFLFGGQGTQFPGMTAGLLRDVPLYRRHLRQVDEALRPFVGRSVLDLIATADPRIAQARFAQPALFAVGYAQAAAFTELGVEPAHLLGHSLGEYAAASMAGVFPLEGAARLVAARGVLMDELPAVGGMLAVRAAEADLTALLDGEPAVVVGAVNGPAETVLSGRRDALDRIAAELACRGVRTRRLEVPHAAHSPLMEPIIERFTAVAEQVGGGVPRMPVYSTVRGRLLENEPMDAGYWVDHLLRPVRFAEAAVRLLATGRPTVLVELGAKPVLSPQIQRIGPRRVRTLHPAPSAESGGQALAAVIAELFRLGVDPSWPALYSTAERAQAHRLAAYKFSDTDRYWDRKPVTAVRLDAGDRLSADAAEWRGDRAEAHPARADGRDPDDEVWYTVVAAISQVGDYAPGRISHRSRFYEDLGFDSLMAMQLKDLIDVRLTPVRELTTHDLLTNMSTVGDLAGYLRAHCARAAGRAPETRAPEAV
jgi:acyl transferase domain-containing protein